MVVARHNVRHTEAEKLAEGWHCLRHHRVGEGQVKDCMICIEHAVGDEVSACVSYRYILSVPAGKLCDDGRTEVEL